MKYFLKKISIVVLCIYFTPSYFFDNKTQSNNKKELCPPKSMVNTTTLPNDDIRNYGKIELPKKKPRYIDVN